MARKIGHESSIPNPARKSFDVLVLKWNTVGAHPLFPALHFTANLFRVDRGRSLFG